MMYEKRNSYWFMIKDLGSLAIAKKAGVFSRQKLLEPVHEN